MLIFTIEKVIQLFFSYDTFSKLGGGELGVLEKSPKGDIPFAIGDFGNAGESIFRGEHTAEKAPDLT